MKISKRVALFLAPMFLLVGLVGACAPAAETPTPQPTATPAPREPKRLEAKITMVMGEMFFANEQGAKGGPFRVPAGKTVGIHIVNNGMTEHEIMFGREVEYHDGNPHGYMTPLFEGVATDVFVYPSGKKVEIETEGMLEEIELEPGADVWIRVKFPENLKGEWEIGCFVPGHYGAGMKATFIIE